MKHRKDFRVFGLLTIFVLSVAAFPKSAVGESGKPEPVKLDLYVMSQCPFGTKAENVVFPAVRSLGKHVDFNLHFIGGEKPAELAGPDGQAPKPVFSSLHGQPEVEENIRHLCAMKLYPKQYMDFILDRNISNAKGPNWQDSAKKAGIDPAKLEACSTGAEGAKLLSDSIKISTARQANSSPTIDLNGRPYTGARGERSITLAVCDVLSSQGISLPDACEKAKNMAPDPATGGPGCEDKAQGGAAAKPPVDFGVKVLVDKTCTFCEPTLIDSIKRQYAGAKVSTIDANSDEGKAFIERYHVQALPFYFFEQKVMQDPMYQNMKGFYVKTGDGFAIIPGPDSYTPAVQLNRPRVPRHLDIFVESGSAFTAQVEAQLMKFLAESDVKELTFSMHYIVQETVKGDSAVVPKEKSPSAGVRAASIKAELGSMSFGPLTTRRGEAELQENMRQACLFQHASIGNFFTYLTCRNQNIMDASRGNTCLQLTEPMRQCMQGSEGESLLRKDARLVRELGITGGPTLLWENRFGPFGWYEVDWKQVIAEQKK